MVSQLSLAAPPAARNCASVAGHGGTLLKHCTVMLDGQVMTGGIVSLRTCTKKLQVLELPQLSVAVQTTVMVPVAKRLPEGGTQVTVTFVPQRFVAVTLKDTTALVAQVQTVMFEGQTIVGGGGVITVMLAPLNAETPAGDKPVS